MPNPKPPSPVGDSLWPPLLAFLALQLLLLAPEWWLPGGSWLQPAIAAEALLVMGLLLGLTRREAGWLPPLLGGGLVLVVALALSDLAAYWSLGRPVNLYLDLPLLASVEHLLTGALGRVGGWALLLAGGVLLLGLAAGAGLAMRALMRHHVGPRRRLLGALLVAAAVGVYAMRNEWPVGLHFAAPAVDRVAAQGERVLATARERESFARALATPSAPAGPASLQRLQGRDVVLAFIESYGESAVRDPRYAPVVQGALEQLAADLDAAGLSVVTGLLRSPVQGGQSWLAHGSLLSGLWLDNQLRYDLFLASPRSSLIDDLEAAGHHSVAVMPALTAAWPQGRLWGYDEVHDYAAIDYAGPPLNWVTMPDQYTWHYFQRAVREPASEPVFAELALISSHAPWTPILPVLPDWSRIGRGEVFGPWADAGPSPGELWRNAERVRAHYAQAVAYALRTAGAWSGRYLGEEALLILLGDHQPAPLITGEETSRAVPVHVVSADPSLLAPLREFGFMAGVLPPEAPNGRLDDVRGWLRAAYGGGPERGVAVAPSTAQ
ncbi:hypothetical protein [Sediminicurvatus halobius]|nr:hypothetical protein [Spiribacter halobius]UEX79841.1 hypothetical protein LMH63_09400 [Spiribacter halobius]